MYVTTENVPTNQTTQTRPDEGSPHRSEQRPPWVADARLPFPEVTRQQKSVVLAGSGSGARAARGMWRLAALCLLAVHSVLGRASAACQAPAPDSVLHVTAEEGRDVRLPCHINAKGAMNAWARRIGDQCHLVALAMDSFQHSEHKRYSIGNWPRVQLVIRQSRWSDSGTYRCHADYQDTNTPAVTRWVRLTVTATDRTIISGDGGSVRRVRTGKTLQLNCLHRADVVWFLNDQPLNVTSGRLRTGVDHADHFLLIFNTSVRDAGRYSCRSAGVRSDSVLVEVLPEQATHPFPDPASATVGPSAIKTLTVLAVILTGWLR